MIAEPQVLYLVKKGMEIPQALAKSSPSRRKLLPRTWGNEKYCTVVMYDPTAPGGHLHWVFWASEDGRAKTLVPYAGPNPLPASAGKDGLPPAHRYIFNVYPGRLNSPTVRNPFDIAVFDRQSKVAGSTEFKVRPLLRRS
jgi:phosphatidylethanolamine-binding protein (PEBP) family uncharacterized protein